MMCRTIFWPNSHRNVSESEGVNKLNYFIAMIISCGLGFICNSFRGRKDFSSPVYSVNRGLRRSGFQNYQQRFDPQVLVKLSNMKSNDGLEESILKGSTVQMELYGRSN